MELPKEEKRMLEAVIPADAMTLVITIQPTVRHVLQNTQLATTATTATTAATNGQIRHAFITTLSALAMTSASPSLFIDPSISGERERDEGTLRLETCLQNYFRREILDFNADYTCEKCKKVVELVRDLQMVHPPLILILHLMRFAFDANGAVKIYENVKYPLHVGDGGKMNGRDWTCRNTLEWRKEAWCRIGERE